ncbi:peptidylprolyl isomerase [Zavarzinia sp. CC-PAN008]|uniref:peptidylprolyl isomerase n=1 Tax=Zavarzinia sp. CC-PAN008 TaxID=3243332 RepID=UPI003F746630
MSSSVVRNASPAIGAILAIGLGFGLTDGGQVGTPALAQAPEAAAPAAPEAAEAAAPQAAAPEATPDAAATSEAAPAEAAPAGAAPAPAEAPAAAAPPAAAEGQPEQAQLPPPDTVVARIDGSEIRLKDVMETLVSLPEQYRQLPIESIYAQLLEQLVDRRLMVNAARTAKLQDTPEYKERLAAAEEQVLQEVWLTTELKNQVDEAGLRARYDTEMKSVPDQVQLHARHILVHTEEEAKAIKAKLDGGADFVTLANEQSNGPASDSGGDLGWFGPEEMVPEFSTAAFKLEPGQISDPVKTPFGWHIIKVEEKRTKPKPSFEEVRAQLEQQVAREAITAKLDTLRQGAKVEMFGLDGSPINPQIQIAPTHGTPGDADHGGGVTPPAGLEMAPQ